MQIESSGSGGSSSTPGDHIYPAGRKEDEGSEHGHKKRQMDVKTNEEAQRLFDGSEARIRASSHYGSVIVDKEDDNDDGFKNTEGRGDAGPFPGEVEGDFAFGLTKYQCLVLFSAWIGWGFDIFDSFLFTYAAPLCIPSLLELKDDVSEEKRREYVTQWTAVLTSVLLVGWGVGGVLFGVVTDKIGRARTMIITIAVYSVATALCAASFAIWWLVLFRFISALGIGGEWAAGASLV
jgi:hypothetical protein